MKRILPYMVLLVTAQVADAQFLESVQNLDENLVRYKYEFTRELPDGPAFTHLTAVMASLDDKSALEVLQHNAGFGDAEAAEMMSLLRKSKYKIAAETALRQEEAACVSGSAKVFGRNTYSKLEEFDDIEDQVSVEQYEILKSSLDSRKRQKLVAWVNSEKENIIVVRLNFEEVHRTKNASGDDTLSALCSGFWMNNQEARDNNRGVRE